MSLPFLFPEGKAFDVVGFGFNTLDHVCVVPRPVGSDSKQRLSAWAQHPGGQVPTTLVALQRWGLRTAYVGPFGDDEGGRLQRASLECEHIDLSGSRFQRGVHSQVSVIVVDQVTGGRTVLWQRPEGLALQADELDPDLLTAGRALLMDADDMETAILVAGWAGAAGVMVVLDVDVPGPRTAELLRLTDVVVVSGDFPQRLTGVSALRPALRRMLAMGPVLAAATLGAGGVLACSGGRCHHAPAHATPVVDTTSAGDLFHAGCLYGLLHQWSTPETLRFATAAAALACQRLGGRPAVPPLDRVLELVAER